MSYHLIDIMMSYLSQTNGLHHSEFGVNKSDFQVFTFFIN